jgi:hypothetical protein
MALLATILPAVVAGLVHTPLVLRRGAVLPLATAPGLRAGVPLAAPRARPPVALTVEVPAPVPPALATLASRLWAWGWLNWWVQGSLSVVSAVLLLFANSVTMPTIGAPALFGRALALGACAASFASTFWAWGYTSLAGRIRRKPDKWTGKSAAAAARKALYIGSAINLVGIGLAIVGAEAIVGTLAAKALTQGSGVVLDAKAAAASIQALDVLIVQANTNTLAACFAGLLASMRLKVAAGATEQKA